MYQLYVKGCGREVDPVDVKDEGRGLRCDRLEDVVLELHPVTTMVVASVFALNVGARRTDHAGDLRHAANPAARGVKLSSISAMPPALPVMGPWPIVSTKSPSHGAQCPQYDAAHAAEAGHDEDGDAQGADRHEARGAAERPPADDTGRRGLLQVSEVSLQGLQQWEVQYTAT